MRLLCTKLLSGLLALMLLLSLTPAAMAAATQLKVELYGLYAADNGAFQSIAVGGVFEVYQNDTLIGTVNVAPDQADVITLPSADAVRLAPVAGSYPAELELNTYGYGLSLTEGRLNIAPISVYAKMAPAATAEPAEEPTATPVVELTAEPTAVPTATPTAEPTAAPTPVPTATPTATPTAEPTATPEPTAAPTEVPVNGTLTLKVEGDEGVTVGCTVMLPDGANAAKGTLALGSNAVINGLRQGEYIVTLNLPENVVMTALNGQPTTQRGMTQWMAVVNAMQESVYTIELTAAGDLVVPFENITGATVMVKGERESFEMTANAEGIFEKKNLLPDTYEIEVSLPAGRYTCEDGHGSWQLTRHEDGACTAVMTFGVTRNSVTELPVISRIITGSVGGTVVDLDGDTLSSVAVEIYDGSEKVAEAKTDKQGQWTIEKLTYGEYSVLYTDDKFAIPADGFVLDDSHVDVRLSAQAEPPAKITVRAFIDDNNNGSCGKDEGFLKGVEVSLVDVNGAVVAAGVTGRDGYVTLAAPDGSYRLRAFAPMDYGFGKLGGKMDYDESVMDETASRTQESEYITLRSDAKAEAGIGLVPMAIVRGTVWKDVNADGVWQDDEPGIPGIRMTLKGGKDKVNLEVVTDENGLYEFRQVKKGSYDLNCHVPDEYVFTVKAKEERKKISRMTTEKDRIGEDSLSLERGEVYENHNIGLMEGLIIEGRCFLDDNYNGQYDEGEMPLPGVEMRLARQSNNVMLQNVISGEDGTYKFVGQRGSTFTIRATLPKGYVFTVKGTGDNANLFAPNGEKTERRLTDLTVENGGYKQVMLGAVKFGSIQGRVYYDKNFSSDWESGEPLGGEMYVALYGADGEKIMTRRADEHGKFSFPDLLPGTYYLGMNPSKGYAFTALGKNNVMITQADGTGMSRPVIVTMGEKVTDAGIGMIVPAVVTGKVFADDSDNGLLDAGEQGLQGTVVRLMGDRGEVSSTEVGKDGAFRFNAVLPGTYYLQYELPEHGVFAEKVDGGNAITGDKGVGRTGSFTVDSGDTWTAPLCGGVLLSDITGAAYADPNGNAQKDADESFVSKMVITLIPSRKDLPIMTVSTGADGKFSFRDMRPDTYTLRVTCPDRYVISRLTDVQMPVEIGKASQDVTFRLEMGTQWHDQMLGCVIPASWTGEAWLDENWDGVRAADEAPANGETIQLRDAETGEVVFSVLTDDNGVFNIDGIAPGEYELVYPMDDGNLTPKGTCDDFTASGSVRTNGRVYIGSDEKKTGTTLCVVRTTEIGGLVWLEEYSGVTPVKGAKLHLLDASGKAIAEFTTGEDGKYSFKGLMPADYALDVTIPAGYVLVENSDVKMAEKGLYSFVEDAEGLFGKSAVITLKMAKHRLDMDAGMVLPGRLGDKAWLDLNGNGLQDGEEGGLPGVTIEVLRGDKVVATAVTDQYGYYTIKGLYPTDYTLRVTWPDEVKPTILREDIKQISSVLREDGTTLVVTVESNKANYAADLGFVLIEEGKLPAGYGEGESQIWKKK